MARKLRLEEEGGVYHIINRGNYRGNIFQSAKAKTAFLKCLSEVCKKTGWRVYAWCVMSNHYHLAIETPRANLVDGMRWLQSTFSMRFNRLRRENGHLFQGRYKSLSVDPKTGLGPLCHYIHLNPVRAKICAIDELGAWPWDSFHWLMDPKARPSWYEAEPALRHAGELEDSPDGRRNYAKYLAWLAEDEPAQKELNFANMSKGWAIGSVKYKKELLEEHSDALTALRRGESETENLRQAILEDKLTSLLRKVGKKRTDLRREGKSVPWKLALAATLKQETTVTNRWLGDNLKMGNMYEVSRKVSAWLRKKEHSSK